VDDDILELCRKLKPVLGSRADALWRYYFSAESYQYKMEAAGMIRQLSLKYLPGDVDGDVIQLPPPRPSSCSGDFVLGDTLFPGTVSSKLAIKKSELQRHCCIVGTTGSGKTTMVFGLVKQLIEAGVPVWIVDWKRSYRNLRRIVGPDKLTVLTVGRDISPFNWNPLRPPPKTEYQSWYSIVCDALERSHISGQGVADVLLEHIEKLSSVMDPDKITLRDVKESVERVKYPGRKGLWQQSCIRILRSFTYGSGPSKAFNSENSIKLETLLRKPVVFELDMSLPKNLRTFFTEAIIRWIHLYRLGQGESSRLRHVLVLEEVHNLVSGRGDIDNSLESVFRELRSFGQGALAITQHPSIIPIWMLGNVHSLISFSLSHAADIEAARKAFFLPFGDERYFDQLRTGQGIVRIKDRISSCHVQFPDIKFKGGRVSDEELTKNAKENLD
jgi:hypothetical protein